MICSIRSSVIAIAAASATILAVGERANARQYQSFRDTMMDLGPVVYWQLDETTGTIAQDETTNNNDGDHLDGPIIGGYRLTRHVDDADDASVVYDGVNDRTRTQAAFDDASGLPTATLAVLMRCEDPTEDGTILSFENPLSDNGVYRIEVVDGAAAMSANGTSFERQTSTTEICDKLFYLVVAVFASQTDRRLYVGPVEVASGTTNLGLSSSGDREFSVADGIRDLGQNDLGPFEGRVSHAAIFDVALSADDVEALYDAFKPRGRFFDLVQETSTDKVRAGIVRLNTSDAFSPFSHPGLFDGENDTHFADRLDIVVDSGAHKYVIADIENGTHNEQSHNLEVVGATGQGPTIIEFDDDPDPYLGPAARQLILKESDPEEKYEVVEENGVDPDNNTIEVEADASHLTSPDEMWISVYDYRLEPHLHVEVAQKWHVERTDPIDLFGIDGHPAASGTYGTNWWTLGTTGTAGRELTAKKQTFCPFPITSEAFITSHRAGARRSTIGRNGPRAGFMAWSGNSRSTPHSQLLCGSPTVRAAAGTKSSGFTNSRSNIPPSL